MACRPIYVAPGITAIVCGMPEPKRCRYCGAEAVALCDFKVPGSRRLCSAPMCAAHSHHEDPNKDFCRLHWRAVQTERAAQLNLNL